MYRGAFPAILVAVGSQEAGRMESQLDHALAINANPPYALRCRASKQRSFQL
jgi:hypothetical protein